MAAWGSVCALTLHYVAATDDGSSWGGYNRPDDGKYEAEYVNQISHIYHFSHALIDDDSENAMAEGMPPSKDIDQNGVTYLYTGANAYRGTGRTGSPSEQAGFPATAPFLDSIVHFELAPEALDDVFLCRENFGLCSVSVCPYVNPVCCGRFARESNTTQIVLQTIKTCGGPTTAATRFKSCLTLFHLST